MLALVCLLGLTGFIGCNRIEYQDSTKKIAQDLKFTQLRTTAEVQRSVNEAANQPCAIFLVNVDWAPMVQQHKRFAEFAREYKGRHPSSKLSFRYIDCTPITQGYQPLRLLPGWKDLEDRNNGSSLVHGYGELVWLKNGRVLHVENPLNFDSTDALIAKTESLGIDCASN